MAVSNIKSFQPMVHTDPHKENSASLAATNILNRSGANPKPPKAINDISAGENSRTNGLLGNTGVGNGLTGKSESAGGVGGVNSPIINPSAYMSQRGKQSNGIVPSAVQNITDSMVPSLMAGQKKSVDSNKLSGAKAKVNNYLNPASKDVQAGQYFNSRGINPTYDADSNGLYAGGYRIPVTRVVNDVPYARQEDVDRIYNKLMYGGSDDDVLSVKHYVGDRGNVTYNEETGQYYLNGQPVPGSRVENGAYVANKSAIDNILAGADVDTLQHLSSRGITPQYDEASDAYFYNGYKLPSSKGENGHTSKQNDLNAMVDYIVSGGRDDDIIGVRSYVGDKGELMYDAKTGNVFLNGMLVPVVSEANGRTYAKRSDIDRILSNSNYKNNDIVRVTDYLSRYGDDARVAYDSSTGNVFVNGELLDVDHISDGKSYASKAKIDDIINRTVNNNPNSKASIVNRIMNSVEKADTYLNDIKNTDRFEYDHTKDPSYKAYADEYDYQMERDIENAVGAALLRTGGYNNSTASAVEAILRQQYGARKAALIPQLEHQAFERWNQGRQNDIELVGKATDVYNNAARTMADLYGTNLSAETQRYGIDADTAMNDKKLSADERMFNKELDLDWAIAGIDKAYKEGSLGLEARKLDQTDASNRNAIMIDIFSRLKGYNGVRNATEIQSVAALIYSLDIPAAEKAGYITMLNNVVGTKYPAPSEILQEHPSESSAVDNIVGAASYDPNGYIGGAAVASPTIMYGNSNYSGGNTPYKVYVPDDNTKTEEEKKTGNSKQYNSKQSNNNAGSGTGASSSITPGFKWDI